MSQVDFNELLESGVHFGHLTRKWNPLMAPYVFGEKKGIHIIDLNKTIVKLDEANAALKQIAKSGKKVLFVATKKQAKDVVAKLAESVNMPYICERWSGGMLTNFATVRKAIRKMNNIDKMFKDGTAATLSKRERLQLTRQREKLEKTLGSISDMSRLPAALFIVDVKKEHIAVAEAKKLNLQTFGMVDTNSNPNVIDFAIPSNDDATKSIETVVSKAVEAIAEGLVERKADREKAKAVSDAKNEDKKEA